MKYYLVACFALVFFQAAAQKVFQYDQQLVVQMGEEDLRMPFAGGINAAQLQEVDLNGDGQEELVHWDKNAAQLMVFENI